MKIRDVERQRNKSAFRSYLEKCGEILAYEVSKDLTYTKQEIATPLAPIKINALKDDVVLGCILRASLPLFQGFLNYYEDAESGFIGAARVHENPDDPEFEIATNYFAFPKIENKTLILIDPMLATGRSLVKSIDYLTKNQKPKRLILVSLIATPEGIDYLRKHVDLDFSLYTAAVDDGLNEQYYIVPGLGDAGDLSFGNKE
jgi:uracil phosphoribosyltransferase